MTRSVFVYIFFFKKACLQDMTFTLNFQRFYLKIVLFFSLWLIDLFFFKCILALAPSASSQSPTPSGILQLLAHCYCSLLQVWSGERATHLCHLLNFVQLLLQLQPTLGRWDACPGGATQPLQLQLRLQLDSLSGGDSKLQATKLEPST